MSYLLSAKPKINHKASYCINFYFNYYYSKKIEYKNNNLN